MGKLKLYLFIAVGGFVAYSVLVADRSGQSADLGQVLDRTVYALETYDGYMKENQIADFGENDMAEFTEFYAEVMNVDPRFYGETLGLAYTRKASFVGYADANENGVRDEAEDDVFTVEIDSANNRLIATDATGAASDYHFSGAGVMAGVLLGSMINRQRRAGVAPNSFNSRVTTPRSAYSAPASARSRSRSGGLGFGK